MNESPYVAYLRDIGGYGSHHDELTWIELEDQIWTDDRLSLGQRTNLLERVRIKKAGIDEKPMDRGSRE